MAGKKTVSEIVDAIVIIIFLMIFVTLVAPYFLVLIRTPAANTLGNLFLTAMDAFENNDARYPLVLKEENDYNLFGTEVYLTQLLLPDEWEEGSCNGLTCNCAPGHVHLENRCSNSKPECTCWSERWDNVWELESSELLINECGQGKTCLCLMNVLNCEGTECTDFGVQRNTCDADEYEDEIAELDPENSGRNCCVPHQSKAERIFKDNIGDVYGLLTYSKMDDVVNEEEELMGLLTLITPNQDVQDYVLKKRETLEDFTLEFLEESKCEAGDEVFFRIMTCLELYEEDDRETEDKGKYVFAEYNERLVALFPTRVFDEYGESRRVELKLERTDRTDDEIILQFDKIIEIK